MATTKKSTGKRSAASTAKSSKPAVARKKASSTRTAATKRTAKSSPRKTAKSSASRSKSARTAEMKSFRVARQNEPFVSLKVTVQTLYWLILAGAVLLLGLWVLNIHNKVQMIYDEIDQSTLLQQELDAKELQILREKAKKD